MTCCTDTANCKTARERVRYFPRQLLGAADMVAEQEHRLARMRWHNRMTHGWGVVCGLDLGLPRNSDGQIDPDSTIVTVCSGYALSPQGDEILVEDCLKIDVTTGLVTPDPCADAWPCPPVTVPVAGREPIVVYIAIRYADCLARPVRMPPGCGCDEAGCEMSRTLSSYELRILYDLPKSHTDAATAEQTWVGQWKAWLASGQSDRQRLPLPTPACAPCPEEPWVVLGAVRLIEQNKALRIVNLDLSPRHVLWPVWAVQAIATST